MHLKKLLRLPEVILTIPLLSKINKSTFLLIFSFFKEVDIVKESN